MRSGHSIRKCRLGPYSECKKWHNTILHDISTSSSEVVDSTGSKSETVSLNNIAVQWQWLLSSVASQVIVSIADKFNNFHKVKILLNCGLQTSFITSKIRQMLHINTQEFLLVHSNLETFKLS